MISPRLNLNQLPVERAVETVIDVPEDFSAQLAAEYLSKVTARCVLVTACGTKRLAGLITVSDLKKLSTAKTAGDMATRKIVAIGLDATIGDAVLLMRGDNSLRRELNLLPVTTADGDALGVVTRAGIDRLSSQLRETSSGGGLSYA
jgi:CBS domain-containing protein